MNLRHGAWLLVLAALGCGNVPAEKVAPLTVAEWKALPPAAKYQADTLERLKDTDPTFNTHEKWETFVRTVVVPGRRRELAAVKR